MRYLAETASLDRSFTPYEGVEELPRGHSLTFTGSHVRIRRFHALTDDAPWAAHRDPQYVARYRDTFLDVVRSAADSAAVVGAENSGGLDSASIIAGLVVGDRPRPRVHSYGMLQFTGDERHMRTVAGLGRTTLDIQPSPTSEEMKSNILLATDRLGHPPVAGTPVWHMGFPSAVAKRGVRMMFSGHAGDHAVTSMGTLAVRELVAHRNWRAAYGSLSGSRWRRLRHLLRETDFTRRRRQGAWSLVGSQNMAHLLPLRFPFDASVAASLKTLPTARIPTAGFRTVNNLVLDYLLHEGVTTRALETNVLAASFGVEYVFPMLDPRLIQCYLSTPAIEKFGAGYSRYLHRRAMAGLVPDSVLWRRPKNDGELVKPDYDPSLVFRGDLPLTVTLPQGLAEPLDGIVDLDADARLHATFSASATPDWLSSFRWNVMLVQQWLERRGGPCDGGHS